MQWFVGSLGAIPAPENHVHLPPIRVENQTINICALPVL